MRDLTLALATSAFPLRFGLLFTGTLLFFAAFYVSSAALVVRLQLTGEPPALIALVLALVGPWSAYRMAHRAKIYANLT